ncbi:MAG: response regulator [Blastocatellia bacterium]
MGGSVGKAVSVGRKRILVVEDSDDSRFSLAKLLDFEGYEVIEAADGERAVALAAETNPDLILMDVSLPIIDGLTAARRIRDSEGLHSVPIIALSGHEFVDIEEEVRESGCSDYLTKPIDFDALTMKIAKYF